MENSQDFANPAVIREILDRANSTAPHGQQNSACYTEIDDGDNSGRIAITLMEEFQNMLRDCGSGEVYHELQEENKPQELPGDAANMLPELR